MIEHNINVCRKSPGDVGLVVSLYHEYSALLREADALRRGASASYKQLSAVEWAPHSRIRFVTCSHAERNSVAATGGTAATAARSAAGQQIKAALAKLEPQLAAVKSRLTAAALLIPCDSHPDAPIGAESAARVVKVVGTPPVFSFPPRDHIELGRRLGILDFEAGAAIAGAGFVVLRGDGVLLELALVQWALSRAAEAGFTLVAAPDVARVDLVEGCGFTPRGSSERVDDGCPLLPSQVYSVAASDLCLVGTSEVSLAGLHAGQLLHASDIPALYSAVSHCFRREAAAGGARDRGLYRLHQFTKVELFALVPSSGGDGDAENDLSLSAASGSLQRSAGAKDPEPAAEAMLARMVDLQTSMLESLGLHFRVLDMPTEELGQSAYRKFDVEAWMPCREGSGAFGEVSSASNCTDFQSRRLNIRHRTGLAVGGNRFVNTLNATACAIPRILLSILETHQQADGTVTVPLPLRPFLGGRSVLHPPSRPRA